MIQDKNDERVFGSENEMLTSGGVRLDIWFVAILWGEIIFYNFCQLVITTCLLQFVF